MPQKLPEKNPPKCKQFCQVTARTESKRKIRKNAKPVRGPIFRPKARTHDKTSHFSRNTVPFTIKDNAAWGEMFFSMGFIYS